MRYLLLLCLVAIHGVAVAQTYRWVDKNGRTIISDSPPPGQARNLATAGQGENSDSQPFAVKIAAENYPVTLYTSAECVAECKQARELLNGRGVPFTEKMLQRQEDIDELKKIVGEAFVPTIRVGKQSSRGFDAGAYNNLLDLAGYPKTALPGSKPSGGMSK
ncbi:MAG: glutaredoxin family protein [Rhodocyclales bacterium GT-UBC]|nr:MAG: glutaredoxin family protein [Rhodocyclales bacterium GT-UBC]